MNKSDKKKAVIFDIDGTLADISHREHYVRQTPKDWKGFMQNMEADQVIEWCHSLINDLKPKYQIIFCTGRPEDYREVTEKWLAKYGITDYILFMRPKGDHRKDTITKKEIYQQEIEPFYDVMFVLEDRDQVVKMWRSLGVVCLQCAEGDF